LAADGLHPFHLPLGIRFEERDGKPTPTSICIRCDAFDGFPWDHGRPTRGVRSVLARGAPDGETSEEVRSTCRRSRVMGAWPPTGRRTCLTVVFCSAKSGLAADMGSATNPKPGDFVQPIPSHPFAKGRVGCAADDSGAARFVNHRVWGAQSASRRYCTFSGGTLGLDPLYRLHL
jgi:hypothetical protein